MTGVLILGGPTASGKTELALALARAFDAEIVGADSRQIYRGMPIGTAAPTEAQRALVAHHLVEFLDPSERYSAARFTHDALAVIEGVAARGRRAIVVGGTGFYVRALCGDVALSAAYDPDLRARLAREAQLHPIDVLHEWLATRDPRRASDVPATDRYRVVRALEIALAAPAAPSVAGSLRAAGIPFAKVWLAVPPEVIDARIVARVDAMLAGGLIEEAERIGPAAVAADAVGYPQVLAYLSGQSTRAEMRALLIRATRRYAKRQQTWWRSEPNALALGGPDAFDEAARVAEEQLGWSR